MGSPFASMLRTITALWQRWTRTRYCASLLTAPMSWNRVSSRSSRGRAFSLMNSAASDDTRRSTRGSPTKFVISTERIPLPRWSDYATLEVPDPAAEVTNDSRLALGPSCPRSPGDRGTALWGAQSRRGAGVGVRAARDRGGIPQSARRGNRGCDVRDTGPRDSHLGGLRLRKISPTGILGARRPGGEVRLQQDRHQQG